MAVAERWPLQLTGEEDLAQEPVAPVAGAEQEQETVPQAPPIHSRFLFINVAAMRAKQLRRGAKPRIEVSIGCEKAEALAMEEIRRGLIPWQVLEA
jgi:DNA-directed RNA polymerase omega subunit